MRETEGKQGVGGILGEQGTYFLVTFIVGSERRREPEVWPMAGPNCDPPGTHI